MHMWRPVTRPTAAMVARNFCSGPVLPADLLHRSELPTAHFQASLPRLPVPKLEDTIRRYLASQSALLGPEQFEHHQKTVEEFKAGPGPQLQKALQEFTKRNSHTSYITDYWFDMYLRDRRPVVLTHTPFTNFTRDPKEAYNAVPIRATNIVYSSLRFLKAYKEGCLSPEVFHLNAAKSDTRSFRRAVSWCPNRVATYIAYLYKAYPLDMSQFSNLFASTRVPMPEKDELRRFDDDSRHLVVLRNGHLYTFDVIDADGNALLPEQILANFEYILTQSPESAPSPLGALTTLDRDLWSKLRNRLEELGNGEMLREVDSALFAISLDDSNLSGDLIQQMHSFLHGLTPNRWFDKSFNIIFDGSGEVGLNFEHSWGDGVAVLRYINEVFKDSSSNPRVHPDTKVPAGISANVKRLDFNLDDAMRDSIKEACETFRDTVSMLELNYRECTAFGKEEVKNAKLSPDSVMQLAFQVAFHKMTGETAATYESCSTSAFKHGRTETVRSGTPETLAFSKLLASGNAESGQLLEAMQKCSDKHNLLVKEAAMGQGWDRHLFALRKMAELDSGATPALFADYFYSHINHIILSTSTLSSPAVTVGGFAAVTPDGYGIGYGIKDQSLGCIVTAYPEIGGTSLTDFLGAFEEASQDIHAVMVGQKPSWY